jgi:hypothetical protein
MARKISASSFQKKFRNSIRAWAADTRFDPSKPEEMDPATGELVEFVTDVHGRGSADRPEHDEFHVDNVVVNLEMTYAALVELTTYLHEAHESFTQDAQKTMVIAAMSGGITPAVREQMAKSTVLAVSAMEMTAQLNDIRREIKETISIPQAHEPHPLDDLTIEGAVIAEAVGADAAATAEQEVPQTQNQVEAEGHTFTIRNDAAWFEDEEE